VGKVPPVPKSGGEVFRNGVIQECSLNEHGPGVNSGPRNG